MALSKRATVFVVGAGLSADLGYPLTRDLLYGLTQKHRLSASLKSEFDKVVRFHHPTWNGRPETLPDIEELLTELAANQDLLSTLRPQGPFKPEKLRGINDRLLVAIAAWFHRIHARGIKNASALRKKLLQRLNEPEYSIIISFNWDLEIDRALFESKSARNMRENYGLDRSRLPNLTLLKPHGSLNWFPSTTGKYLKSDLSELLWEPRDKSGEQFEQIYCFQRWGRPKSHHGRRYVPWIVPPTHLKRFEHPMLQCVWANCVEALSRASKIYFLGYSLPPADWHSGYIFRCGYHNQMEGLPMDRDKPERAKATGPARTIVVNPDNAALRRIESVVGRECVWVPKRIERWLEEGE